MGTFYILCRFYFSFFPGFSSSTIKMKQMLLAALAVSALCVATAAPFRDAAIASRVAELTDEEANEAYGLMELIPGVFDMIEKLRPVIEENFQILLDPNMDMNQKINEIMKVCLPREASSNLARPDFTSTPRPATATGPLKPNATTARLKGVSSVSSVSSVSYARKKRSTARRGGRDHKFGI